MKDDTYAALEAQAAHAAHVIATQYTGYRATIVDRIDARTLRVIALRGENVPHDYGRRIECFIEIAEGGACTLRAAEQEKVAA